MKNIVITGASRGIGAAISNRFAKEEINALFMISRNASEMHKIRQGIISQSPDIKVIVLPVDLSDPEAISSAAGAIKEEVGHIDILINNAGYLYKEDFENSNLSEIDKSFRINYTAPVLMIQKLFPLLKAAENAHVVNIASMAGFQGSSKFPGLSHYSASKAALASLTECLATEFKGEIMVNCLAIGAVGTEMLAEAFPGYEAPLKPHEMADFMVDFALKTGKYMNGKILPVSLATP